MPSTEKTIQNALVVLLEAAEAELRIDDREVAVTTQLNAEFSQRRLPAIYVERPVQSAASRLNSEENRDEYTVAVVLLDSFRPTADGRDEAEERLGLLRKKVELALWAEPTLGLIALGVMAPFWEFRQVAEEPIIVGNNLVALDCKLSVPVVLRRPG